MDAKTLCLGALTLGDASGYEIRKQFEEGPFAFFHDVSFASIYPALAKLNDDGLVIGRELAQDGRPAKKVYSITETGREAFRTALDKPPASDKFRSEAIYMMFFADLLPDRRRREVYESYLALHKEYVAGMEAELDSDAPGDGKDIWRAASGHRFVHGAGLAIYRALVDYMETHRHLVLGQEEDR